MKIYEGMDKRHYGSVGMNKCSGSALCIISMIPLEIHFKGEFDNRSGFSTAHC